MKLNLLSIIKYLPFICIFLFNYKYISFQVEKSFCSVKIKLKRSLSLQNK